MSKSVNKSQCVFGNSRMVSKLYMSTFFGNRKYASIYRKIDRSAKRAVGLGKGIYDIM